MRTWRLKLVEASNATKTPGWSLCITRALIAAPLVAIGGIGYWFSFFDEQKRSLHDRLSRTKILLTEKEK